MDIRKAFLQLLNESKNGIVSDRVLETFLGSEFTAHERIEVANRLVNENIIEVKKSASNEVIYVKKKELSSKQITDLFENQRETVMTVLSSVQSCSLEELCKQTKINKRILKKLCDDLEKQGRIVLKTFNFKGDTRSEYTLLNQPRPEAGFGENLLYTDKGLDKNKVEIVNKCVLACLQTPSTEEDLLRKCAKDRILKYVNEGLLRKILKVLVLDRRLAKLKDIYFIPGLGQNIWGEEQKKTPLNIWAFSLFPCHAKKGDFRCVDRNYSSKKRVFECDFMNHLFY